MQRDVARRGFLPVQWEGEQYGIYDESGYFMFIFLDVWLMIEEGKKYQVLHPIRFSV